MAECDFSKKYWLIDSEGNTYISGTPGTLGGHAKLKLYGRLDCLSALGHITKGHYVKHRVFFKDESTAISAGFRPCSRCLKSEYITWKGNVSASD
jgi:hypothetical protein